jgi:hypothetical protein
MKKAMPEITRQIKVYDDSVRPGKRKKIKLQSAEMSKPILSVNVTCFDETS